MSFRAKMLPFTLQKKKQMIWFFTPYSFNKKLFEAIDQYMNLVANPEDWVFIADGDTAFLRSDFGHQIKNYIEKYPDTGLFTCYASRCHNSRQVRKGTEMNNPNIIYHKNRAEETYKLFDGQIKEINHRISGHLWGIQKKTWVKICPEVAKKVVTQDKKILGVDTKISNAIMNHGLKIRLMRGMYIFHYLRLVEGFNSTKHLQ